MAKRLFNSVLVPIFLIILLMEPFVESYLRYTEQSCTDLTPKQTYDQPNKSRFSEWITKRDNYETEIPFRIIAKGKRYRRDQHVIVEIEGGPFDGLMLQARSISGSGGVGGGEYRSNGKGGVGIVGHFEHLKFPFKYLTCFDIPGSTVIDEGQPIKLGNVTFIWRAPEQDVGDIRFTASVLRGKQYWVIVSNTLTFNPFPISTYSCGSTLSCYRICPQENHPTCVPKDALLSVSYYVDLDKRHIEFTLGGLLRHNNSYIAVAFGEEYENLRQADMSACFMDRGRAKVEHLLIENLLFSPYVHSEPIDVDDYDLHLDEDGNNKLWCRFRRSINPLKSPYFDINKPLYHFHFWGTLDHYFQRFILPNHRSDIYASAYMRNFTQAVNEIVSAGCPTLNRQSTGYIFVMIVSRLIFYIKIQI